ncbi:hypothetical protein KKE99_02125, partial [Patescibacteria group bacterium]|nr:hypothetical protein [Patescibacteria group bacterium]
IGVYSGAGFLAYILAPLGGMFHRIFWESRGCGWWIPCDKGAYFEGFIYFFIYFLAVFSFYALRQKTAWKVYVAGTFIFWALIIYTIIDSHKLYRNEYLGSLIIMLCAFGLGYLSAVGGGKVIKKMKE